jgi:Carbohydrate binding domain
MTYTARNLTLILAGCVASGYAGAIHMERASSLTDPCSQTSWPIPNGGFESGSLGPWVPHLGSSDASIKVVSPGNGSAHAVQLHGGYTAGIQQQHIPLCPGYEYQVFVDYKVISANDTCVLHLAAEHGNHSIANNIFLEAGDWTTWSGYYIDEHSDDFVLGAQLRCVQQANTQATVLLDNWRVEQTRYVNQSDCPIPIPVVNGGFESGSINPFSTSSTAGGPGTGGNASIVTPGYESNYALQVEMIPDKTQPIWFGLNLFPFQTACINDLNIFSMAVNWVNWDGPTGTIDPFNSTQRGCAMMVNIVECIFSNKRDYAFIFPTTDPGWRNYSFSCERKSRSSDFTIGVQCNTGENGGPAIPPFTMLWDDIFVATENNTSKG